MDPSLALAAVLLQMKLPASLLGPYSHCLRAVAALFTIEDSSKVFAIGNIEQVAVADGTVDARRATGSSSAEYLRQLSMNQRSNGVFINDPKGLFILRWYREVKGDGTPQTLGPRGRVETRVCVVESCWSPLDIVISVDSVSEPDSTPTAPPNST